MWTIPLQVLILMAGIKTPLTDAWQELKPDRIEAIQVYKEEFRPWPGSKLPDHADLTKQQEAFVMFYVHTMDACYEAGGRWLFDPDGCATVKVRTTCVDGYKLDHETSAPWFYWCQKVELLKSAKNDKEK